jgi:hypothetical protein
MPADVKRALFAFLYNGPEPYDPEPAARHFEATGKPAMAAAVRAMAATVDKGAR